MCKDIIFLTDAKIYKHIFLKKNNTCLLYIQVACRKKYAGYNTAAITDPITERLVCG